MEESSNDLVEIREEDMVSPSGGTQFRRTAHFLKPPLKCIKKPALDFLPNSLFSETTISKPEKLPLVVTFNGCLHPVEGWETWEEQLRSKYEHIWRSAGIYEAIKASTYQIQRSNDLILGLAQKWYSETNTFIFSWGEATITLEDIMVCGGYSVVGAPVFTPPEDEESKELVQKLDQARRNLIKTKARRASHLPWLRHFMEEKGELEHAAFLSLWLSRFVFPPTIIKQIFPIAIHLARGTRIALAPAILASIYRDLRLLKRSMDHAMKLGTSKSGECGISAILRAPFKLVQIWAFERFPTLHRKPNVIEYKQPRIAKWHKVKLLNHENVSLTLDSCGQSFIWLPYKNSPKFYNEKDGWVCFSTDSHEDLESFARCLRHSELVGIELDHCTEKYLPHRVGMQFGLDQDIPGRVARCKDINPMVAWANYNKPITDKMLCNAAVASSSILKPRVTFKYLKWWRQSKRESISSSENLVQASTELRSLSRKDQAADSDEEDGLTVKELPRSHNHRSFVNDETDSVLPSPIAADKYGVSMAEGAENLAKTDNVNVVGGLKRANGDAKSENVFGKVKRAKEGENGDNGKEGEAISTCTTDIEFSDLETRIVKLERYVDKLKAAKCGRKFEKFGARAGLS